MMISRSDTIRLLIIGAVVTAVIIGVGLGIKHTLERANAAAETTDSRVVPAIPQHTDVPCGVPTHVTVPESTLEVTYEGKATTYGYYKVIATLTDQSATFNLEGTGYRSTSLAPYRAEHLTQVIEPCRDADPVVPILPEETQPPTPAPEPTEAIKPCENN